MAKKENKDIEQLGRPEGDWIIIEKLNRMPTNEELEALKKMDISFEIRKNGEEYQLWMLLSDLERFFNKKSEKKVSNHQKCSNCGQNYEIKITTEKPRNEENMYI